MVDVIKFEFLSDADNYTAILSKNNMSNQQISRLYFTVRRNDVRSNNVTEADIKAAIEDMKEVYMPRPLSLYSTDKPIADYNTVAHMCAYLYKYAPLHSAIVRDELKTILNQKDYIFWEFHDKLATSKLKICSLGGGPGSDIVGIAAALSEMNVFQCSAKVVDLKADWEDTLRSVIQELRSGDYGVVGQCFQAENFDWDYLTADLLEDEIRGDVFEAVGEADLVTMVKFVSAASCQTTYSMLKKIFGMLKPGTLVLFIDNASGGFSELMTKVSKECNMTCLYVEDHKHYIYEDLGIKNLCGYMSCYKTTITIHMMKKQDRNEELSLVFDQCKNIARAEAGWSIMEEPIPRLAQSLCKDLNGLVYHVFEENITDFKDCTNGLVTQGGCEETDSDFADCTNGVVAQGGFEENVSDVVDCTNGLVTQGFQETFSDDVDCTNAFDVGKEKRYQPLSVSVEIIVENELESQVNCCSSCVIS